MQPVSCHHGQGPFAPRLGSYMESRMEIPDDAIPCPSGLYKNGENPPYVGLLPYQSVDCRASKQLPAATIVAENM